MQRIGANSARGKHFRLHEYPIAFWAPYHGYISQYHWCYLPKIHVQQHYCSDGSIVQSCQFTQQQKYSDGYTNVEDHSRA